MKVGARVFLGEGVLTTRRSERSPPPGAAPKEDMMNHWSNFAAGVAALLGVTALTPLAAPAQAQEKPPNILVIMGDDVGWFNIGAYHRGIMSGKTPNLDQLAAEGMTFGCLLLLARAACAMAPPGPSV